MQRVQFSISHVRKVPVIIFLFFVCMLVALFTVYLTVFNHAPPSEILEANRQKVQSKRHPENNDQDIMDISDKYAEHWQHFVDSNNLVSIGDVYDKCEKGRQTIGKVTLLKDEETGGLKARTYVNITLESELNVGEFSVLVKYNGKELYDNKWEFCSMDENQKVRQIFCPYKPGVMYSWVTDKKIPTFIPKGRYETKAWLTGDNGELLTCGTSVLIL